ncbi:MAG: 30S ribosomal protein S4 [Pelagibacteraceae bacterium]|nr:30S ribosomal protein S4 [Pelagibacteraceae bacterium]|tara:strand:- start:181 stop:798 length:618 start_codon:yes stop_codon:yes gene_type:complete
MTKRIAQKHKIDRRLSVNLWGRPKSPFNLRKYRPGQHGQKHTGKLSDYGVQLNAKQKLKGYYGNLNERQFRNCYKEAIRQKGDSGENLIAILERRLDTVVYRSKFVPTVFAARQFINHGHVKVNGKRVNIASYLLKESDVVEVKDKSRELALVVESQKSQEREIPGYISVDEKKCSTTFVRVPQFAEVPYATQMDPKLVIEYYSR